MTRYSSDYFSILIPVEPAGRCLPIALRFNRGNGGFGRAFWHFNDQGLRG
jgi:hypothetical protein